MCLDTPRYKVATQASQSTSLTPWSSYGKTRAIREAEAIGNLCGVDIIIYFFCRSMFFGKPDARAILI